MWCWSRVAISANVCKSYLSFLQIFYCRENRKTSIVLNFVDISALWILQTYCIESEYIGTLTAAPFQEERTEAPIGKGQN